MKVVEVHWIDTQSQDDLSIEEAEKACPTEAVSFGLLIVKDEEKVNISGTRFRQGELRQVLTIPAKNVIGIKELADFDCT